MESYSFLANIDSEVNRVGEADDHFEITNTQARPPIPREKLFKKVKPRVQLRKSKYEEEKKEIKRMELVNQQRQVFYFKLNSFIDDEEEEESSKED